MSRSPLAYPLGRGIDADAGGLADLQTDVMRFMAILSLCLVAIFALVQSMPVSPAASPPDSPTVARPPAEAPARPATPAEPAPEAPPRPAPPVAAAPAAEPRPPQPLPASDEPAPPPPSAPVEPVEEGFTLRFESDTALKALVARGDIGLYAVASGKARRLAMERGRLQFWQSSLPSAMHDMDAATVPADVVAALGRAVEAQDVRWGVTLPRRLVSQLDGYLSTRTGGSLVISAAGDMRLE